MGIRKIRNWFKLKGIEKAITGYAINWADLKHEGRQQSMEREDKSCYDFIECVYEENPRETAKQKRIYNLLKHIIYSRRYSV